MAKMAKVDKNFLYRWAKITMDNVHQKLPWLTLADNHPGRCRVKIGMTLNYPYKSWSKTTLASFLILAF